MFKVGDKVRVMTRSEMVSKFGLRCDGALNGSLIYTPDTMIDELAGKKFVVTECDYRRVYGHGTSWNLGIDLVVHDKKDFKAGELIRIRQWDDMEQEFGLRASGSIDCKCYFTKSMKYLCGKEFIIEEVRPSGVIKLKDMRDYNFSVDMLEYPEKTSEVVALKKELAAKEEEIAELKKRIEDVMKEQERSNNLCASVCRLNYGDKYYYLGTYEVNESKEEEHRVDAMRFESGNYFQTREAAERALFERSLMAKLQRISLKNGGADINLNKLEQVHVIVYDADDETLTVVDYLWTRNIGEVYFKTREAAEEAMTELHDDLIRYFTTCK